MNILKWVFRGVIGVVLVGFVAFFILGQTSQNGKALGLVNGRLAPCPSSPNCVSSEEGIEADKAVAMLPAQAWDKLPQTVEAMGGTVTKRDGNYIATEFQSAIFGFVDDVEFRKAEDGVHVRSASRAGYSDAGVNAARVAELRAKVGG